jgi:O-acetyl-ADP-ribose deacetylase (regulator of RNase III)
MQIELMKGDITKIAADAIINAANNELWMGAGVAGAIKRKGGIKIEEEAISKGPIKHGSAIETTAGNLKAKFVIHAAAMRSDGYITEDTLRNSVIESINIAEKLQLESIAFPAIGTGVAGFPINQCAKIMIDIFKEYNYSSINQIQIVLFSEKIFQIFKSELGSEKIEF